MRFIAGLLDTTDERREIAGDEGWAIRGDGGFSGRLKIDGSRRKNRSESELDGSGEAVAKKS